MGVLSSRQSLTVTSRVTSFHGQNSSNSIGGFTTICVLQPRCVFAFVDNIIHLWKWIIHFVGPFTVKTLLCGPQVELDITYIWLHWEVTPSPVMCNFSTRVPLFKALLWLWWITASGAAHSVRYRIIFLLKTPHKFSIKVLSIFSLLDSKFDPNSF